MKSLEEAWKWYQSTQRQLRLLKRLASRYWDKLPWENLLAKDDQFRMLEGAEVQAQADFVLAHLDDLAIVVLFSVFESTVRDHLSVELVTEAATIRHRAVRLAAEQAMQQIEEGSFFQVLEPFKDEHAPLVEEINQVRRYRNWVAHGRRGDAPAAVEPRAAYRRLRRFLDILSNEPAPVESWVI